MASGLFPRSPKPTWSKDRYVLVPARASIPNKVNAASLWEIQKRVGMFCWYDAWLEHSVLLQGGGPTMWGTVTCSEECAFQLFITRT